MTGCFWLGLCLSEAAELTETGVCALESPERLEEVDCVAVGFLSGKSTDVVLFAGDGLESPLRTLDVSLDRLGGGGMACLSS